jgi:formamidopyrimidine-DNA glycosylase
VPELPEVERNRRLAADVASDRRIVAVEVTPDPIVLCDTKPKAWNRALMGRTVVDVHRYGKYFYFELDERPWPLFHLGMTGAIITPDEPALELEAGVNDNGEWPPRFTKIRLTFDDGGQLAFTNARRLGRVRLQQDPMSEAPLARLGFDPLLAMPSPKAFVRQLQARRGLMKGILLDQSFAAGVGNWIADEVLYRAGVSPHRRGSDLSDAEARAVRRELGLVIRKAVAVNAEKKRYPRTWLFHRRWGRIDGAVSARGEAIVHDTIAGRTTAWCPAAQR